MQYVILIDLAINSQRKPATTRLDVEKYIMKLAFLSGSDPYQNNVVKWAFVRCLGVVHTVRSKYLAKYPIDTYHSEKAINLICDIKMELKYDNSEWNTLKSNHENPNLTFKFVIHMSYDLLGYNDARSNNIHSKLSNVLHNVSN